MIKLIFLFLASAVVSFFLTFPIIWLFNIFKIGQPIREEAPTTHKAKAGVPTLGGIALVLTVISFFLTLVDFGFNPQYLALFFLVLVYAFLGLVDDLIKISTRRNLGLTFWQKIIFQSVIAGFFAIYLTALGHNFTLSGWLKSWGFSNPFLYQLLMVFMIVGTANAANLTDGLDGLLAGVAGVAFLVFAFLSGKAGAGEALTFSLVFAGALFAFLFHNFPKAKIFMGDVGSLAIGAALAGLAILLHRELRLIIIGGVLVVEAFSVIVQVTTYKLFKTRIFRMTPLHHHFELMGFKEWVVVVGFWVAAAILGVLGTLFI